MWVLLITWISLEPNLARLGEPMTRMNSEVLYSYESRELCEWAREWVLENNVGSRLSNNPTTKAYCLQKSQTLPNEDSQSSPAQ